MEFNLRVLDRRGQSLGRGADLRLTTGSASIGRSPECELCLEDPERVVSGTHARVELRHDGAWITDTSRNGTYLNHSTEPLPSHQAVPLKNGDRLSVGPYELLVEIGGDAGGVLAARMDPLATGGADALPGMSDPGQATDILDLLSPAAHAGTGAPGSGGQDVLDGPARHLTDDPFADAAALDSRLASAVPSEEHAEAPYRQTPVENVFYRPAEAAPEGYDLLGDRWTGTASGPDADPQERDPMVEIAPSPERAPGAAEPPMSALEGYDLLSGEWIGTPPQIDAEASAPPPDQAPAPVVAKLAQTPTPSPSSHQRSSTGGEFAAFLDGLGVGEEEGVQDSRALLRTAGALLRELTTGLTLAMMGRAQFKSELRLGVTTIRPTENNPFKFSADTNDILDRLLFRPSAGFLPAVDAAGEAFDDIRAHEMAMTAGLQAALRALLARFEPAVLEQRLDDRSGLDRVLPMARKARRWDRFTATYEQVAADAAEDFMQLFGDAFAQAYRDQIERLKQARQGRKG